MGTQKNRLDETVFLSPDKLCYKLWVSKYLQFYAEIFCLSKPIKLLMTKNVLQVHVMMMTPCSNATTMAGV